MPVRLAATRIAEHWLAVVLSGVLLFTGILLVQPAHGFSLLCHDPWVYQGYFIDLPGHLAAFPDRYFSSRLTMTLPGWLTYKVLPPAAANYTLHLGVYLVGVLALYATVRQTVNARAGLWAALLLGGQFHFVRSVSSDYADGYAIGYFLLTLALLARAARSDRWRGWLFLAGASFAALAIVNLAYGILLSVSIGLFALVANASGGRRPLDAAAFWVGAGGLCLIVALGLITRRLGGPFWFLAPSLSFFQTWSSVNGPSPFKMPLEHWLPMAGWMVLPVAVGVGTALRLVMTWHDRASETPLMRLYQWQMVGYLLVLAAYESTPRGVFLQTFFYVQAVLLPLALLALAALLGGWLEERSDAEYLAVVGLTMLLPIALSGVVLPTGAVVAGLAVAAALLAVVVLGCKPRWMVAAVALGVLALSDVAALGLWRNIDLSDSRHTNVPRGVVRPDKQFAERRPDLFSRLHQAMRQVRDLDPAYQAAFWFDITEPQGCLFTNLSCLHCYHRRNLVNNRFPDVKPMGTPVQAGKRLLLVSGNPQAVQRMHEAVAAEGLTARVLCERSGGEGPFQFTIYLIETERAPGVARRAAGEEGS